MSRAIGAIERSSATINTKQSSFFWVPIAERMLFSFSHEHLEFRSIVRRFLEDRSPPTEVCRLMETREGCDSQVWRQMSQDLGLTAIHIPQIYGGQGFGISELAITVEESPQPCWVRRPS